MATLYNLARMTISAGGTGTLTLAGASPGYLTFDNAGVQNGDTVAYGIRDGANSETGTGVYTTATKTLTRSVTVSTNSNNAIDASLSAEVYITARAEDILTPDEADAAYQPLDSDLTSIAALTTTTYGRSLLTLADDDALAAEITDLGLTWSAAQVWSTAGSIKGATAVTTDVTTGAGFWYNGNVTASRAFLGMQETSDVLFRLYSTALVGNVWSVALDTGAMTFGYGITLPATGLTVGASVPFSDAAGTLTLQNIDALDSTTEGTIESAIDTLGNLTSIQGVSFTFGSYAATLLNNTTEAGFKQAVNLEIGTDIQAYDAGLADIAGLAVTDGNIIVGDGANWVAESGATARTSLGLGTGNSPQFTAIELGHASDTTIARSGAGDITIEGNAVYRAGGTDVPVADGGTGASTLTGLLQGNGTSAFTAVTDSSTVGQVLRVTGASTYAWGALDLADGDARTGTLPVANGGTGQTTEAEAIGEMVQALTADATPDWLADYIPSYDASADTGKKLLLSTVWREKLLAARTYYVRDDGSDSNTGLVDSAGGAFLTWQHAFDVISSSLDLAGFTVTVSNTQTSKTWTAGIDFSAGWVGGGAIVINGNGATNTIFSITGGDCFGNGGAFPGYVQLQNLKMQTTTSGYCVNQRGTGIIYLGAGIEFGACAAFHLRAVQAGGSIQAYDNYTISGGAVAHFFSDTGAIIVTFGQTVTVSGTPDFSLAFAYCSTAAQIFSQSVTFSGAATGARYSVSLNGVINTGGAGATYFPGDSAGATASGGIYA
jgi:hypothetical protein